jgi:hypothetical protein
LKPFPELLESVVVEPAFKHTFLNPDAEVEAHLSHPFEPARMSDVVSDEAQHFFSPRWVSVGLRGQ